MDIFVKRSPMSNNSIFYCCILMMQRHTKIKQELFDFVLSHLHASWKAIFYNNRPSSHFTHAVAVFNRKGEQCSRLWCWMDHSALEWIWRAHLYKTNISFSILLWAWCQFAWKWNNVPHAILGPYSSKHINNGLVRGPFQWQNLEILFSQSSHGEFSLECIWVDR